MMIIKNAQLQVGRKVRNEDKSPEKAVRVKCLGLPHCGGDRNSFKPLVSGLAEEGIELWTVSYPGRVKSDGGQLLVSVSELAEEVFKVMHCPETPAWNDLPLIVLGHSLGGIVAYELVRRLSARSTIEVYALVVSAVKSPLRLSEVNNQLMQNGWLDAHHCKNDRELIAYIKSINGLPAGVAQEFLEMKLPCIRGDYKAFETYRAADLDNEDLPLQLNCDVVSFGGAWDPAVSAEDISGWGLNTVKSYKAIEFPGSHFFYSEEKCTQPCVEELVKLSKKFESPAAMQGDALPSRRSDIEP